MRDGLELADQLGGDLLVELAAVDQDAELVEEERLDVEMGLGVGEHGDDGQAVGCFVGIDFSGLSPIIDHLFVVRGPRFRVLLHGLVPWLQSKHWLLGFVRKQLLQIPHFNLALGDREEGVGLIDDLEPADWAAL